ncbi:MAG: tetratricopeptide repeat protein [Candidatus Stahlbacteria bacterium]|nr:MAG: tetratricopeptide repeat protein [Candidatus Stahlbacteria bacterium]
MSEETIRILVIAATFIGGIGGLAYLFDWIRKIIEAKKKRKEIPKSIDQVKEQFGLEDIETYLDELIKNIVKIKVRRVLLLYDGIHAMLAYKYPEAIKQFNKCFKSASKASERIAYVNLIGICQRISGLTWDAEKSFIRMRDMAQQADLKPAVAAALGNLGIVYRTFGNFHKALEYENIALTIDEEISFLRGQGLRLTRIGSIYRILGETQKALDYQNKARKLAEKTRDKKLLSKVLGNTGVIYQINLNESKKALDLHMEALAIDKKTKWIQGQAADLGNIGNVYLTLGEPQKALEYYEKALEIAEQIGNLEVQASILGNIGNVYYTLGENKKALEYHQKALEINEKIGRLEGQANQLGNIGNVYNTLGESRKALECYEQARAIFVKIGVKLEIEKADRHIALARQALAEQ